MNNLNEILIHILYFSDWKTNCFTEQQSNFPQSQAGPGYPTQSSHAFQQAGYVPSKSPVKYNPGSQSAFSSYSNPYAHQQTKQLQESGFPAYRMQQPGIFFFFKLLFYKWKLLVCLWIFNGILQNITVSSTFIKYQFSWISLLIDEQNQMVIEVQLLMTNCIDRIIFIRCRNFQEILNAS